MLNIVQINERARIWLRAAGFYCEMSAKTDNHHARMHLKDLCKVSGVLLPGAACKVYANQDYTDFCFEVPYCLAITPEGQHYLYLCIYNQDSRELIGTTEHSEEDGVRLWDVSNCIVL